MGVGLGVAPGPKLTSFDLGLSMLALFKPVTAKKYWV